MSPLSVRRSLRPALSACVAGALVLGAGVAVSPANADDFPDAPPVGAEVSTTSADIECVPGAPLSTADYRGLSAQIDGVVLPDPTGARPDSIPQAEKELAKAKSDVFHRLKKACAGEYTYNQVMWTMQWFHDDVAMAMGALKFPVQAITSVTTKGGHVAAMPFDGRALRVKATVQTGIDGQGRPITREWTLRYDDLDMSYEPAALGVNHGSVGVVPELYAPGYTPAPRTFTVEATPNVEVYAGKSRYETSLAVLEADKAGDKNGKPVFVVSGTAFADALVATPAARAVGGVVVLSDPDAMAPEMVAALQARAPSEVYVIGGTGVMSQSVVDQLREELGLEPQRIRGVSRYETAAAVAARFFTDEGAPAGASGVLLASGEGLVDALTGSVPAAQRGWPILFAEHASAKLPSATVAALQGVRPATVLIAGGTLAVHRDMEARLRVDLGIPAVRASGKSKFGTAAALAAYVAQPGDGPQAQAGKGVVLANGTALADVLAYAHVAAAKGWPIYLAERTCVPAESADAIPAWYGTRVVVGGSLVLDPVFATSVPRC